jgi:poly-beta-1,6-N-acetyl-D-glucosamine synthase
VDDGSEDDSEIIARSLEKQGKIDLFLSNKPRGGKSSAANLGLRYARGKYVLHLDADTSYYRDAIEQILIPFYENENVGAVGGTLEVRNSKASLATRFQSIEYLLNFTVGRMVTTSLGILRVISGAFGAFRTDLLRKLGGWDVGPGMDGDITLKIRKTGYTVTYTPLAVCLTSVPETFSALAKQRIRWNRSLVRFRFRKHRDFLFPSENFTFPNFFAVLDNIFFNFILNFLWWFYLIELSINFTPDLFYIFVAGAILYTISKTLEFGIVPMLASSKTDKVSLLPYIPGMTFYTGFYIRAVRTYAYLMEIFMQDSYKDEWNPEKTSQPVKEVDKKITAIFTKK